uniref:Uncharacterized protein n=1 Tax=Setaria italica TaxID=4555 RepID=K3YKG8_SETIT
MRTVSGGTMFTFSWAWGGADSSFLGNGSGNGHSPNPHICFYLRAQAIGCKLRRRPVCSRPAIPVRMQCMRLLLVPAFKILYGVCVRRSLESRY